MHVLSHVVLRDGGCDGAHVWQCESATGTFDALHPDQQTILEKAYQARICHYYAA